MASVHHELFFVVFTVLTCDKQNQELVTEGEVSRVGASDGEQVTRLQDKVAELQAEVRLPRSIEFAERYIRHTDRYTHLSFSS